MAFFNWYEEYEEANIRKYEKLNDIFDGKLNAQIITITRIKRFKITKFRKCPSPMRCDDLCSSKIMAKFYLYSIKCLIKFSWFFGSGIRMMVLMSAVVVIAICIELY